MDVASVPEDCRNCYLITDVRRLKVIQGEMERNTDWSRDTKTNKTSLLVGLPLYKTFVPIFESLLWSHFCITSTFVIRFGRRYERRLGADGGRVVDGKRRESPPSLRSDRPGGAHVQFGHFEGRF